MARVGDPDRRLTLGVLVAVVLLAVLVGRLLFLQGLDPDALAKTALDRRATTIELPAHRGDILDRSGAVLATTVERRNITADQVLVRAFKGRPGSPATPAVPPGVAGAAELLGGPLTLPESEIATRLTGQRRFVYLVKDVTPEIWREVARLQVDGIFSEQASRRTYPGADVGASLLGFLGKDGTPLAGLERTLQSSLAGTDGELKYERGRKGQQIATGLTSEVDPVAGHDVQLTIDRDLQWKAQALVAAKVRETRAESGSAVIMDTRTGDVLALASVPTFDANEPGAAQSADLQNRALTDVFEPGSTSKVITAAAALEEGKVTPASRLTVNQTVRRGGKIFHDSHGHPPEKLTFAGVLAKSSNVGTIRVGERVPAATMHSYLTGFGVGVPTEVGLPASRGILAPVSEWSNSQRYTVLFGQGLSVTALQAAGVFSTIANDGVRVPPRLVKAVTGPDGRLAERPARQGTRVISTTTARQLRQILERVVGDDGTAVRATIPGYRVAGKTGTAQAYDDRLGRYSGYTASFIGLAPADDPRLVVAVFLQRPVKGYYGGLVAAPVFQELMTYALARRGVQPTGTTAPRVPLTWK